MKTHVLPQFVPHFQDGSDNIHAGVERAACGFHQSLDTWLWTQGITLKDYAKRMGISPSLLVSRITDYTEELTLPNMVYAAAVVDCEVVIGLKPKHQETKQLAAPGIPEIAAGIIINRQTLEDVVLLGQRPEGKNLEGLWEFPGGKVEPGEQPLDALIRELREELGHDVIVNTPLPSFVCTSPLLSRGGVRVHAYLCYLMERDRIKLLAHSQHAWYSGAGLKSCHSLFLTPVTDMLRKMPQVQTALRMSLE